jgi:hypothetical protein
LLGKPPALSGLALVLVDACLAPKRRATYHPAVRDPAGKEVGRL